MLCSLATIGVLAFPAFVFLRVRVNKGVSQKNVGVSENNGVSDKTGRVEYLKYLQYT